MSIFDRATNSQAIDEQATDNVVQIETELNDCDTMRFIATCKAMETVMPEQVLHCFASGALDDRIQACCDIAGAGPRDMLPWLTRPNEDARSDERMGLAAAVFDAVGDVARTPPQRLADSGAIALGAVLEMEAQIKALQRLFDRLDPNARCLL
jgi:hypothetical protein